MPIPMTHQDIVKEAPNDFEEPKQRTDEEPSPNPKKETSMFFKGEKFQNYKFKQASPINDVVEKEEEEQKDEAENVVFDKDDIFT